MAPASGGPTGNNGATSPAKTRPSPSPSASRTTKVVPSKTRRSCPLRLLLTREPSVKVERPRRSPDRPALSTSSGEKRRAAPLTAPALEGTETAQPQTTRVAGPPAPAGSALPRRLAVAPALTPAAPVPLTWQMNVLTEALALTTFPANRVEVPLPLKTRRFPLVPMKPPSKAKVSRGP